MPEQHAHPCDDIISVKSNLFAIKVGSAVAAFFIGLFFVYVMSFFSQVGEMNMSLVKIQEQLAQLVKNAESSAKVLAGSSDDMGLLKDRISALELILEGKK